MLKTLLLTRHAKSSWDFDVDDFDRPLNSRGKADAPKMAQRLLERRFEIELFVTSPAKRAMSTATIFAECYKRPANLVAVSALYEASTNIYEKVIADCSDQYSSIALFAHNPTITEFANLLTNTRIDDMPTCAVFAVQAATKHWRDFMSADKTFLFFDFPKA